MMICDKTECFSSCSSELLHSTQHHVWSLFWVFILLSQHRLLPLVYFAPSIWHHVYAAPLRHLASGPTLISWCLSHERKFFFSQTWHRSAVIPRPITVHKKHTYSDRKMAGLCVSLGNKYILVVVVVVVLILSIYLKQVIIGAYSKMNELSAYLGMDAHLY